MKIRKLRVLSAALVAAMMIGSIPASASELPAENPVQASEIMEDAAAVESEVAEAISEENDTAALLAEEGTSETAVPQDKEKPEEESEESEETEESEESEGTEETEEESEEEIRNGLVTEDGKLYYYIDGEKYVGYRAVTVDGVTDRYYFTADGSAFTGGFLELINAGKTYYFFFGADGKAVNGAYKATSIRHKADIDGNISDISDGVVYRYYFRSNGQAFCYGVLELINAGKNYTFFFNPDGTALNGAYKATNVRYRADINGNVSNISDGKVYRYYFRSNGQAFANGLLEFVNAGKTYYFYFNPDGTAAYGAYKATTLSYKADANGLVKDVADGNCYRYYFQDNGQAFTSGHLKFTNAGASYEMFFQSNGRALADQVKTITTRYQADANGKVSVWSTGSYKYNYAVNCQGSVVYNGWKQVNGTWKYYSSTGSLLFSSNGLHKAWTKIANTSSATSYFAVVDTVACETYIFKGKAGNWTPVKCWKCSPGKSSTPTIKGTYAVGAKGYSFSGPKGNPDYTCYYYTQIKGSYLFHSVLYHYKTFNVKDGRLGQNLSHGCVRLHIDNAKWIQDNVPTRSKILIY